MLHHCFVVKYFQGIFVYFSHACAGADYRPSSIHVGVAGGGLWRSLQSSLLFYLPTVNRLCIMFFFFV